MLSIVSAARVFKLVDIIVANVALSGISAQLICVSLTFPTTTVPGQIAQSKLLPDLLWVITAIAIGFASVTGRFKRDTLIN